MLKIILYSFLLLLGMTASQTLDITPLRPWVGAVTNACLAYIMIEVGLEFTLNKSRLKSYGADYIVSASAAVLPWLFCAGYFALVLKTSWKESFLVGCFAAPTSAGVLFAMLAAAGLGATWVFKKAQVLAIFDDLFTILLLIPLKILFTGIKPELFAVIGIMLFLLFAAYRWLHALRLPATKSWILAYGIALTALSAVMERTTHIHLEVLLPAFVLGCVIWNPHDSHAAAGHAGQHPSAKPENRSIRLMDLGVKSLFMFLVGLSLPKIFLGNAGTAEVAWHVLWISVLSNLGKCLPALFYKAEASFKERLALSVTMFPRGEVGAGVLLIALGYGLNGLPATLAGLSLAVNLVLIGFFILVVKRLIHKTHGGHPVGVE